MRGYADFPQAECAATSKKYSFYSATTLACKCSSSSPGIPEDVYSDSSDSSGTCYYDSWQVSGS